ncbi:MAG: two-component sensor histidine kinase, partial [Bacillota bacterium]|nr:two-component sensor histidine kinase [Bacillota bacterium]
MKSVNQFIKRFISILFFSSVAILIINIALLFFFTENYANNSSPYGYTEELAGKFRTENGRYVLSADIEKKMTEQNYWAVIIENNSKKVVWQSKNLPNEIPKNYSISDIAELTRG